VTTQRAPIFEQDDLDLSDFQAAQPGKERGFAPPHHVRRVAESVAFRSREPVSIPVYRRYRTGRNVQLNIKVRQDTLDAFNQLCDTYGWVQGETLERAIVALERELAAGEMSPGSP
jgi:hypothetical protein